MHALLLLLGFCFLLVLPSVQAEEETKTAADKSKSSASKTTAKKSSSEYSYASLLIPTAVQFNVAFKTPIDSRKTLDGARIEAILKEDLVVDGQIVAPEDSKIIGHVEYVRHARRMTESVLANKGRFKQNTVLKVIFSRITTPDGENIDIIGRLSQQSATITREGGRFEREVEIGKDGEFNRAEEVLTSGDKVWSNLIGQGVSTVLTPLGSVASFGALPAAMGIMGAMEPELVTNKPVTQDDKHVRIKGFTLGVVESLPGGMFMTPFIVKGSELRIKQGDEYLVQVHSPYNPSEKVSAQMQSVSAVKLNSDPSKTEMKVSAQIRPSTSSTPSKQAVKPKAIVKPTVVDSSDLPVSEDSVAPAIAKPAATTGPSAPTPGKN